MAISRNFLFSQDLYIEPANSGIDQLLDELASNHLITLNSVIKPYSRKLVEEKLKEALLKDSILNKRQHEEILLYMNNYRQEMTTPGPIKEIQRSNLLFANINPVSIGLQSKNISFSLSPLLDYRQFINNNASVYSMREGAGIFFYLGTHVALSGGIVKTFENQVLANTIYYTNEPGGKWNYYSNGGGDYTEWFGQLTCSWKWGNVGIYKERFQWGNNYNGANIFTDKPPSFPFIKLAMKPAKWIEFTYIHGWLVSNVIDSNRTLIENPGGKIYYIPKHIAANLVTFIPWENLDISIGNSIEYDGDIRLSYLIPVLFYKSVDHTLSDNINNENSQMFLDISSRQIKHLHLYLTLFVDEFMLSRIFHKNEHNFLSWKGGLRLSGLPRNSYLVLEGTRTLPMTYQHYIRTITFESENYNFGNYLRDNSQEIYAEIGYKPLQGLTFSAVYNYAEHGDDYIYGEVMDPVTVPVLKNILWHSQTFTLTGRCEIVSNSSVFISLSYRQTGGSEVPKYTPPLFSGTTNTLSFGFQVGF